MTSPPSPLDRLRVRGRGAAGAFVLGGPGTFVREEEGALVVGVRPSWLHALAALLLLAGAGGGAWLLATEGRPLLAALVAAGALALAGLVVTGRASIAVSRGRVVETSGRRRTEWAPRAPAVRLVVEEEWSDGTAWRAHQAQVRVGDSDAWLPVAESLDERAARAFAERLAKAAGARVVGEGDAP